MIYISKEIRIMLRHFGIFFFRTYFTYQNLFIDFDAYFKSKIIKSVNIIWMSLLLFFIIFQGNNPKYYRFSCTI